MYTLIGALVGFIAYFIFGIFLNAAFNFGIDSKFGYILGAIGGGYLGWLNDQRGSNVVSGNAQTDPLATTTTNESRKCPFCAEMVKREAVVCRFCQHELPRYTSEPISVKTQDSSACAAAIVENISTEQQQLMDKLGITHDGEKFQFKEYKYEKLEDVVNYAKKNQQNQI